MEVKSRSSRNRKSPTDILRGQLLSSFENFIRYFLVVKYGFKPDLYDYQIKIVDKLEDVISGKVTRLNINIPPRYRKTHIAVKLFIAYCMALTKGKAKFIHLSYSQKLALDNSEEVRDIIMSAEFQILFPEVQIKKDSKAKEKWYTTAGGGVYATAAGGQVTGFGAGSSPEEYEDDQQDEADYYENITADEKINDFKIRDVIAEFFEEGWNPNEKFGGGIIIDDGNKPEDADSPGALKKVNQRYDTTIKNRVNSRYTPIINIQQRISKKDLSGHLQSLKNKSGEPVFENLILPAIDEEGNALCPAIHTIDELNQLKEENEPVFNCQYQQKPQALEGLMYEVINRSELDRKTVIENAEHIFSSTDANMSDGNDYFHTWFWAIYQGRIFIFDAIHEQFSASNLKDAYIQQNTINNCQIAVIEQNNQQTFIGEVENKMPCMILPIYNTSNKLSRMIAKRYLMKYVYFLYNEDNRSYEKAIEHMKEFNKNGSSEDGHDDPEDAWTLGMEYIWENFRQLLIAA